MKLAKNEGKLHLISQVKSQNIPALNLHKKMGFFVYFKGLNEDNEFEDCVDYNLS